jgi:DNA-binding transcriptional regulator YiaG
MSWAEERFEAGRDLEPDEVAPEANALNTALRRYNDAAQAVERMADLEILKAAIAKSGLSASKFAETVMARESRTIRRWLKGESPIPGAAVMFLQRYVEKKR